MPNLLLELFSEEMPARMQAGAVTQLQEKISAALKEARLEYGDMRTFVTPRRLAISVNNLPAQQPDISVERKGPKVGAPAKALEGFLKSTGLSENQLETRQLDKGEFYFAVIEEKGTPTADALKTIIEDILYGFHWPKSMRWGSGSLQWVRPLHNICCLLDSDVVPVAFHHLEANNITYGHRFMAPEAIKLNNADAKNYVDALRKANVLADAQERKAKILAEAKAVAQKAGLALVEDSGLLQEVTGLVEWPVLLMGKIDDAFMQLPLEVLVSEMREHQKYFAVKEGSGFQVSGASNSLTPETQNPTPLSNHFLITSNMIADDNGAAIIHGNERVLRARLADGQFFWDQDRNTPLSDWAKKLENVIFHAKLGSIGDKITRVKSLAQLLAVFVPHANLTHVGRAAELCKADLVTGMVGEFPDLQGIMGRYYALEQQESAEVADAICEHYMPVGANAPLPQQPVSITLALADKMDTLMGLFAIGEKPTGSKDPFALRRAAAGILRIITTHQLRIPLRILIDHAAKQFAKKTFATDKDTVAEELLAFFIDRLRVMLREQGIGHDRIAAVFNDGAEDDMTRLVARTYALEDFLKTDNGANVLAAYKRASNIIAAEEKKDGLSYDGEVNEGAFSEEAEHTLLKALEEVSAPVKDALDKEEYAEAMILLATLRAPLDAYFETVMVNVEDTDMRQNRLFTLSQLRRTMNAVANFECVEGS